MENIFTTKGKLALSIGEGYSILFNGHFLCTGEVVVCNAFFGVRVTGFFPTMETAEVPANVDDPIEMLPVMVQLAEADPVSADSSN